MSLTLFASNAGLEGRLLVLPGLKQLEDISSSVKRASINFKAALPGSACLTVCKTSSRSRPFYNYCTTGHSCNYVPCINLPKQNRDWSSLYPFIGMIKCSNNEVGLSNPGLQLHLNWPLIKLWVYFKAWSQMVHNIVLLEHTSLPMSFLKMHDDVFNLFN